MLTNRFFLNVFGVSLGIFSIIFFAENTIAAPVYTFAPGKIPTLSMSSLTFNGAPFLGKPGFSSKFPDRVTELQQAQANGTMNFSNNDNSVGTGSVKFTYTDADGKQQTIVNDENVKPGDPNIQEATNAYKNFLKAQQAKPLQDECIFMEGGNVNQQFNPSTLPPGVTTKGTPNGFGKYNPLNPTDPVTNSHENLLITAEKIGTYEQRFAEVAKQAGEDVAKNNGKKVKIFLPNAGQTVDGALAKQYNVNGVIVQAGKKYTVDSLGDDGITVDKDCNPTEGPAPKDPGTKGGQPFKGLGGNPGSGAGGGGGGLGGLGGGAGGLGGLSSLLPLLMSGMLGGGNQQGNLANQNAQNQYNQQNQCSYYGVSPVCGSDGKSYNNSCYLQQYGVVQVSTGACAATTPTPQPTPNVASIVTQLVNSGVPTSVISAILNSISSILNHTNTGATVVQ